MAINRMFTDSEKAVEKRVRKLSKEYLMNWWGWWTVSVLQDQEIVDGMEENTHLILAGLFQRR